MPSCCRYITALLVAGFIACGKDSRNPEQAKHASRADTLVLYCAGSLARALTAASDSFSQMKGGVVVHLESAGSLETARKLTDLGRIPDFIALADREVFSQLLEPTFVRDDIPFARNRMVLIYSPQSRGAGQLSGDAWWRVLGEPGVEVGRSDPSQDPAGYRTLLLFKLAARHYGEPELDDLLLRSAPARNIRPKSADLIALLQTGELDYAWGYESVAASANLPYRILPKEIDLSSPGDSARYAQVTVSVDMGRGRRLEFHGSPIVFSVAVPQAAPHARIGAAFLDYLRSPAGAAVLRSHKIDVLAEFQKTGL
jgi:molybdate/tungstate transport system substrate-binding protein